MTSPESQPVYDALQRLKAQRDKLNARIQQTEARERSRERKQDLRRKILVGACILEQACKDKAYGQLVQQMDCYLTRNIDRQLFDLPMLSDDKQQPASPETVETASPHDDS